MATNHDNSGHADREVIPPGFTPAEQPQRSQPRRQPQSQPQPQQPQQPRPQVQQPAPTLGQLAQVEVRSLRSSLRDQTTLAEAYSDAAQRLEQQVAQLQAENVVLRGRVAAQDKELDKVHARLAELIGQEDEDEDASEGGDDSPIPLLSPGGNLSLPEGSVQP